MTCSENGQRRLFWPKILPMHDIGRVEHKCIGTPNPSYVRSATLCERNWLIRSPSRRDCQAFELFY